MVVTCKWCGRPIATDHAAQTGWLHVDSRAFLACKHFAEPASPAPAQPCTEIATCSCGALVVKQKDGTGIHYGAWFGGECRYQFAEPAVVSEAASNYASDGRYVTYQSWINVKAENERLQKSHDALVEVAKIQELGDKCRQVDTDDGFPADLLEQYRRVISKHGLKEKFHHSGEQLHGLARRLRNDALVTAAKLKEGK